MAKHVLTTVCLLGSLFAPVAVAPLAAQIEEVVDTTVQGDPTPRNWTPPAYPPDVLAEKIEGRVVLEFVVDEEGRVIDPVVKEGGDIKPSDPRLQAAALAAARTWTFAPALIDGKPEARALRVPVSFLVKGRGGKPSVILPLAPESPPIRSTRDKYLPDPPYPEEVLHRKLPGSAHFQFEVNREGRVEDITVLYASDAVFVQPGIATLKRWTFEPARQGPLPVVSRKRSPMEFYVAGMNVTNADVLAANHITGLAATGADTPPVVLSLPAPVYPRERLIAGETGTAEVEFVITEKGVTEHVAVMSASQPEFGRALAAAVGMWQFKAATRELTRVAVTLRAKHEFALNPQSPEARVVAAIKAGEITGAKGLDARLTPVWRVPPQYPEELLADKPTGEATIEFIIDRGGRVRFPRVLSATHEAFGWAAATAVSQWVFVPPTRGGEAVDVRVNIPVEFAPPET